MKSPMRDFGPGDPFLSFFPRRTHMRVRHGTWTNGLNGVYYFNGVMYVIELKKQAMTFFSRHKMGLNL